MRIGVFSDSLPHLDRRSMFKWCAERNMVDLEIGVGAWGPWPRPHLDLATVGTKAERDWMNQVLAPIIGRPAGKVPGIDSLLWGPIARGTQVSVG